MDAELWTRLRLSLQRAMWESVTSDLRGVAIALDDAERPAFRVRFLYAGAVGDLQEELVSLVETYLVSDFNEVPDSLTTSFSVIPHAARELEEGEHWFFLRWEPEAEESVRPGHTRRATAAEGHGTYESGTGDREALTSGTIEIDDWLARQRNLLEALVGVTVTSWDGVEMAIREDSGDGPQFTDPQVRFLQLAWLRLRSGPDEQTIGVYQGDGWFGLCVEAAGRPSPQDCYGIMRWRALDLPVGRIDGVKIDFDEGTLARITLTIDGRDLLLVAGEVCETLDGRLEVHRLDESVLVFRDPVEAEKVHWM
ncbi:hypothetical protein [Microlunatus antarcticus]|uniref:Uncharacterized protein n=1 Tax=Microlunatus antarcticus TaxID=53388 RepID=A0A7W5P6L2_9ACTN|nr:hypothetical protein [Microlunatus antarcticus]MBB3326482.1 hypothetical protein [Microlunatus antarcticus]